MRTYIRSFDEVVLVGAFLCLIQIADAMFTFAGVQRFGIAAEGNVLLQSAMHHLGSLPALALFKSIAVVLIVILTTFRRRISWLKGAMGAVTVIYLFCAIFPWVYILTSRA